MRSPANWGNGARNSTEMMADEQKYTPARDLPPGWRPAWLEARTTGSKTWFSIFVLPCDHGEQLLSPFKLSFLTEDVIL